MASSHQQRRQCRVIDEITRNRRNRQMLDKLEKDNFHEDPHANLVMHKKAPKFEDQNSGPRRSVGHSHQHHRSRQFTFNSLLQEVMKSPSPNYSTQISPPPGPVVVEDRLLFTIIKRHFCCVCGFSANYTCVTCGMRYCCINCLQTHRDTRCLKWTA